MQTVIAQGSINKILQTRWPEQNNLLFLTVLEARKPKSKVSTSLVSSVAPLLGLHMAAFWLSLTSFVYVCVHVYTHTHIPDASSSWEHQSCWIIAPSIWLHITLVTSLKTLSLNKVTLGLRATTHGFGGDTVWSISQTLSDIFHMYTIFNELPFMYKCSINGNLYNLHFT